MQIVTAGEPDASDRSRALGTRLNGGKDSTASPEELWRAGAATAAQIADLLADLHALPRGHFEEVSSHPHLLTHLSRRYLRDVHLFPFDDGGRIACAVADPGRTEALKALQLALGQAAALQVLSFEEIELLFERAAAEVEPDSGVAALEAPAPDPLADSLETIQDLARGAPVVRLIDDILERAIGVGATDIHMETERDHLRIRFRVDGYLRKDQRLPVSMAPAVISRIKILAGLDIADRRLPQDGRANVRIGSSEADLRVAVMPTLYGETAVLRILLRDAKLLELGRMGMSAHDQRVFEALLTEPHGIVIVTGPTGSGKTTTLATAMSLLNNPSRKIMTVEDPVEYQIAGIHQTQIKPTIGLTFASALRSFLRHDPDIIMVGEMRDGETAAIGIQAALTGHLVMTTLHTNSASDAVVRLIDMGVEPYLLASSLRGVLGQRLVRRLCDRCKVPDDEAVRGAERLASERGLKLPREGTFFSAQGCEACGQTGYRGRIAIFEVMRADQALRDMIRQAPEPHRIAEYARADGMTLMIEDGLAKCAKGLTTVEEVVGAAG